ncbi:MAG: biotin--[acetyl-CoA-carboxylase] ligase [Methanobacteriota archaeon]
MDSSFHKQITQVATHLKKKGFPYTIQGFNELDSTNGKAKELALAGVHENTVVVAQIQKKGRGRFERTWESPPGGLYFSLILRPKGPADQMTMIPLIAGLAVTKAIRSLFQLPSMIKWPNDVRIHGKKVAGILLEGETKQDQVHYVIVGVGVNVNNPVEQLPIQLQATATSLIRERGTRVDYGLFFESVLSAFHEEFIRFEQGDVSSLLSSWKTYSDTLGKRVKIKTVSGDIVGEAVDIDCSGFLVVLTDDGEQKIVTSGDCLYVDEL